MYLFRGNAKQREHVCDIIRSEHSMLDSAKKRDPDTCFVKPCNFKEIEAYYVDSTGASVTAESSVSLIDRYCAKLPSDKYVSFFICLFLLDIFTFHLKVEKWAGLVGWVVGQIYATKWVLLCMSRNGLGWVDPKQFCPNTYFFF